MAKSSVIESNRYKVLSRLGSGGMAVVYKCKDESVNRLVALKLLQENPTDKMIARLHTEARAIAKLEHLNIVKVLDFGQLDNGRLFLAMDYVEGEDLGSRIKREKTIRLSQAVPLLKQVCQGMRHSHDNGVLHRDIKPSNVLLLKDKKGDQVKLVDFGIAKIEDSKQQNLTGNGAALGSPPYMSPEHIRGKDASKASDIYSFGCMMFEMLTGKPPFLGDTAAQTMILHTKEPAPTLYETSSIEFPEKIEEIVEKCLRKNAEERYQDFDQIINAFTEYEEAGELSSSEQDSGEQDSRDSAASNSNKLKLSKRKIISVTVLACLLTFAAALFFFNNQFGNEKAENNEVQSSEDRLDPGESTIKSGIDSLADTKPYLFRKAKNAPGHYTIMGNVGPGENNLSFLKDRKDIVLLIFRMDNLKGDILAPVSELPLERLRLMESEIDAESLEHISKIESLKQLEILQCYGFKNEDLKCLAALKNLDDLALERSILDNKGLEHILELKSLKSLNLSDNQALDYKCIEDLKRLPKLDRLLLVNDKIKEADFAKLKELKKLRNLELSFLPPNFFSVLSKMNLNTMIIKDNPYITDEEALQLTRLNSLKHIKFSRCDKLSSGFEAKFKESRPDISISGVNVQKTGIEAILVP